MGETGNPEKEGAETVVGGASAAGKNKIQLALSDSAVINNLLRVIHILDDEKVILAQDVENLCQQLEMRDEMRSDCSGEEGESTGTSEMPPFEPASKTFICDKGTLHSRVEHLTRLLSECITYRDKILSSSSSQQEGARPKLNFGDKFKILDLVQAAHEFKYQRIMREVLVGSQLDLTKC